MLRRSELTHTHRYGQNHTGNRTSLCLSCRVVAYATSFHPNGLSSGSVRHREVAPMFNADSDCEELFHRLK